MTAKRLPLFAIVLGIVSRLGIFTCSLACNVMYLWGKEGGGIEVPMSPRSILYYDDR